MTTPGRWPPVVVRSRWQIAVTYVLTVVDLAFVISYPWATGVAIDGLLAGNPTALTALVAIWLSHTGVGVVRQAYDTRLFTRLYAETVTHMIGQQGSSGASTAMLAGRSALARELIEFLEDDIPAFLAAILGCLGSLVLLTVYEPRAGALALALLVPVAVLNWRYGKRAATLNAEINDAAEREVDIIAARRRPAVVAHFRRLALLRVRLSDAEVRTWGITELFVVAGVVGTLLLLTSPPPTSPGQIYAVLAYLFAFVEGLNAVPNTVERSIQALDVMVRLIPREAQG